MTLTGLTRTLGAQDIGTRPSVGLSRDLLWTAFKILYDESTILSESAERMLQRMIGTYTESAKVRITPVLIQSSINNLRSAATRPGSDGDKRFAILGVTTDWLIVTDGERYGEAGDQVMIMGTIESTGQRAVLFGSTHDENKKELILLDEDEDA